MSTPFARVDFPLLQKKVHGKPLVYLDSAATSLKPQSVIDAVTHFYAEEYGTVHRAVYALAQNSTALYSAAREKVRAFLNAKHVEEIVFTKGTTDALNLVAVSFAKSFLHPGDEIVITEMEHHSNIVPWQLVCTERSLKLKVVPVLENGTLDVEAYKNLLSPRTKIVSLTYVSNTLGTINPLAELISLAHTHGAKVVIDGAQAAPHLLLDVQALDADFFAFSGHKVYGPTGIGILYGKKELLEQMSPYQGGGDMIETVTFENTTFQKPPLKFEAGTPSIAAVIGLKAALDYIDAHGKASLAAYEHTLLTHATQLLQTIPHLRILGTAPHKGPLITFTLADKHPLDIGTLLDLQGVAVRTGHLCTQPLLRRFGLTAAIRASFAPYNTLQEIDYFVDALGKVIALL